MSEDPRQQDPEHGGDSAEKGTNAALEVSFILFIGVVIVAAFCTALTYDIVSARTPIVIMVPLLGLIGFQIYRSLNSTRHASAGTDLMHAIKGANPVFNKLLGFLGWLLLLLLLIFVAGHYAGIALFMFILMYLVAEEDLVLSLSITAIVTLLIYCLFEYVFSIELYRGLIYRIWAGYSVF